MNYLRQWGCYKYKEKGYPNLISLNIYQLRIGVNGLWMVCEWFVNGLWMVCEWFMNGLWMVCEWFVNGL